MIGYDFSEKASRLGTVLQSSRPWQVEAIRSQEQFHNTLEASNIQMASYVADVRVIMYV